MNWKVIILQSLISEAIFISEALVGQSGLAPGIKTAVENLIVAGQQAIQAIQSGK